MYNDFAGLYDQLITQDIDYNKVCDYIQDVFKRYHKTPGIVCDLACGTGNITVPMQNRGYDMIGVDISENMLNVARGKSEDILFICQDIKKLDLFGSCDAFLCMTDGFNYITSLNALTNIFKRIRNCFINDGGIFVFDISTRHKLENILGNNTYIYNTDDVYYSWENEYKSPFCKMELNFFVKDNTGYKRFDEVQIQRAYTMKEIENALLVSGISSVDAYKAYTFEKPEPTDERLVFVAQM